MSILITVAFGLLGSNLCYEFLKDRKKVVAYDWVVECHDIVDKKRCHDIVEFVL
jgi:UDP-glucose 4-epimerase